MSVSLKWIQKKKCNFIEVYKMKLSVGCLVLLHKKVNVMFVLHMP